MSELRALLARKLHWLADRISPETAFRQMVPYRVKYVPGGWGFQVSESSGARIWYRPEEHADIWKVDVPTYGT